LPSSVLTHVHLRTLAFASSEGSFTTDRGRSRARIRADNFSGRSPQSSPPCAFELPNLVPPDFRRDGDRARECLPVRARIRDDTRFARSVVPAWSGVMSTRSPLSVLRRSGRPRRCRRLLSAAISSFQEHPEVRPNLDSSMRPRFPVSASEARVGDFAPFLPAALAGQS